MASKVLVPAPFTALQVKKSPPETAGTGFIIGSTDAVARVAHLEHSVRFLQEQHRLMLSGLHAEIEALRERNRDLQFQLIFNKESSPKTSPATSEDIPESNEEGQLKRDVSRLEREAAAARGEARAAEARALQLQRLVDAQTERLRQLDLSPSCACSETETEAGSARSAEDESRAELRARLAEAERLVRRLRGDAERQRREVQRHGHGREPHDERGVTNLLFDDVAAAHAHLQCMKNSLHASLRATGLDGGGFGYQNNYHFPPVHAPEFWREPIREDFSMLGTRGRSTRRPLLLPELSATGHQIHRATIYANHYTRSRPNGYEIKKKTQTTTNGETNYSVKTPEETSEITSIKTKEYRDIPKKPNKLESINTYPELKMVITKLIPHDKVSNGQISETTRARPKRNHHRKQATDNT